MSPSIVRAHLSRVRILYRKILQLHRALPLELKALGDQYVKDEFRRHKEVGPKEAQCFLQEWENYAEMLRQQVSHSLQTSARLPCFGSHLPGEKLNTLRDEQVRQLHELMGEATKPKRQFGILDDTEQKT